MSFSFSFFSLIYNYTALYLKSELQYFVPYNLFFFPFIFIFTSHTSQCLIKPTAVYIEFQFCLIRYAFSSEHRINSWNGDLRELASRPSEFVINLPVDEMRERMNRDNRTIMQDKVQEHDFERGKIQSRRIMLYIRGNTSLLEIYIPTFITCISTMLFT